jgi:hypothetical protein
MDNFLVVNNYMKDRTAIDLVLALRKVSRTTIFSSSWEHSFKNWTRPPVEPEKTGTGASAGLLSAKDRSGK